MESSTITKRKKTAYILVGSMMCVLLAASIVLTFSFGFLQKDADYLQMTSTVIGMLFAVILFFCCFFNNYDNTRQGDIFALVSVLLYFCILMSGITDVLAGKGMAVRAIPALLTLTAINCTAVQLLFWHYQCSSLPENRLKRYFTQWIICLAVLYLILLAVNCFTGILFAVDASGNMSFAGETIELIFTSLFYLTYLLYILPQHCPLAKKLTLTAFAFFPLLCIVLTMIWYIMDIESTNLSVTYVFLLMAAYVVFFGDYIESRRLLFLQKKELAEQAQKQTELRTELMLSQIRPHFLFNALTAIRSLCKKDPEKAYTALGWFSEYLRSNIDTLGNGSVILFEKELEHIKTYLMLEQMRFGEDLRVEYDIQYRDFSLPGLTVQPIVENAVRHGATMNENGGVVTIRSEKTEQGALITVTDNGPGFVPGTLPSDGRSHLGLRNVEQCLSASGCGSLAIESIPGVGTTVRITVLEAKK